MQAGIVSAVVAGDLGQVGRGQRSSRIENIVRFAAGLRTTPGALLDGLPFPED